MPIRRGLVAAVALSAALSGAVTLTSAPAGAATCDPGPRANCAGVDLSGRNLEGVDLTKANFHGANLSGARLVSAKLDGANLSYANLSHANLDDAGLAGTQLAYADLSRASLQRVRAAEASFALTKMGDVNAGGGHFQGANFYAAFLHGAQFAHAYLGHASFVAADFHNTGFLAAHITETRVGPSNIGEDPSARYYFFQRVYTHVNAYGSSGSCSGSGSGANHHVECNGQNDDPAAVRELAKSVNFVWGSQRTDGRRGFTVKGKNGSDSADLIGVADMGLASFYVKYVVGTIHWNSVSYTRDNAPRGHVGGPLALVIDYHHSFPTSGYHMNLQGWIQRGDVAPATAVPR